MGFKGLFQARYVFALMAMLGLASGFMMRVCLSLVITKLVINPDDNDYPHSSTDAQFSWSEETQGYILASFYWGYIITHIPGGYLSKKFGGKYVYGIGILITAVLTLITPLTLADDPTAFIILRFFEGIGEGTTFPALYTLLAQWAPPSEKSLISTFTLMGGLFGSLLANLISGFILQYVTYNSYNVVFYCFGSISVIWFILWCILCYDDPITHPFISFEEKQYLIKEMSAISREKDMPIPWRNIFTNVPVWALVIANFGHDWGIYTVITDFPKYMHDVLHFSPIENGVVSSLSYSGIFICGILNSILCDYLLRHKILTVSKLRKTHATLTVVGLSSGILIGSYIKNLTLVSICFIIGMSCLSFGFTSIKVTALDLSPNYAGSITSIVNGLGCFGGIITPCLTGILTPNRSAEEWRSVFWIMAAILLSTNFVYVFFGSCKTQSWNYEDDRRGLIETHFIQNVRNQLV